MRSHTFIDTTVRATGRGSFKQAIALVFGTGIIQGCFHKLGIDLVVKDLLKMNVKIVLHSFSTSW